MNRLDRIILGFGVSAFSFCCTMSRAQTPIQTSVDTVGFNPNQMTLQTSVSALVYAADGSTVPGGQITVYFIPEVYDQTPSEFACTGSVSYQAGSCEWYIDPPGEYLVQVHYSGVWDDATQSYIYAPSDSWIYDVVGGPGFANGYPRNP